MKWMRAFRLLYAGAGFCFTAWFFWGFQCVELPQGTLESDAEVLMVRGDEGIEFRPPGAAKPKALVFLPGGIVDPVAYAPLMRRVAGEGHRAVLVFLPWRIALSEGQQRQVYTRVGQILNAGGDWVLAGHSRGAMLATRFVEEHKPRLAGLALIGTTHPKDLNLSGLSYPVAKIYGTEDGVASYSQIRRNAKLLPLATKWIAIEGGNHVQFGYYRHQLGDNAAGISRETQQEKTAAALLGMLRD